MVRDTCACGTRMQENPCGAWRSNVGRTAQTLPCDNTCALLLRNRKLAEALDIDRPELGVGAPSPPPTEFEPELLKVASQNKAWVVQLEKALASFVSTPTQRLLHLPHATKKSQATFVEGLVRHYNLTSETVDLERRMPSVLVRKMKDVKAVIPKALISNLAQNYKPPSVTKTLASTLVSSLSSTGSSSLTSSLASASTQPTTTPTPKKELPNAIRIHGLLETLGVDEIRTLVQPHLSASIPFQLLKSDSGAWILQPATPLTNTETFDWVTESELKLVVLIVDGWASEVCGCVWADASQVGRVRQASAVAGGSAWGSKLRETGLVAGVRNRFEGLGLDESEERGSKVEEKEELVVVKDERKEREDVQDTGTPDDWEELMG
ncbi:FKBP12-associated protein [Chytridiales sp. JEL 0842]|nr:FKBP12-associated protein [Chytridiales sp. JEL 0842]